ncbi:hypothetical protein MalM25_13170 [Planctomycetes bacterium MalM25]|nr:hypothetical protein MalM25_13170 [Planctomycetes bacterium MalM25]
MARYFHGASVRGTLALMIGCLIAATACADLSPGLISDFNDGTRQGWDPPNGNTSNPGTFLEIVSAPNLAAFTGDLFGVIDPAVNAVQMDLMRPAGQSDLEMRLVLVSIDDNRWTTTLSQTAPGDGGWRDYTFSTLEADLTRVKGNAPYTDLVANFSRLLIRYDPGEPSPGGAFASGLLAMDNVYALGNSLAGDFNGDSVVDAADYTVWRDNTGGGFTPADYSMWSDNYGATQASNAKAVPEPNAALLALAGCLLHAKIRRR